MTQHVPRLSVNLDLFYFVEGQKIHVNTLVIHPVGKTISIELMQNLVDDWVDENQHICENLPPLNWSEAPHSRTH